MVAILLEARAFCAFTYKDTAATFGVQFYPNSFNLGPCGQAHAEFDVDAHTVSNWVMVSY
jgi:hypothetical protein